MNLSLQVLISLLCVLYRESVAGLMCMICYSVNERMLTVTNCELPSRSKLHSQIHVLLYVSSVL